MLKRKSLGGFSISELQEGLIKACRKKDAKEVLFTFIEALSAGEDVFQLIFYESVFPSISLHPEIMEAAVKVFLNPTFENILFLSCFSPFFIYADKSPFNHQTFNVLRMSNINPTDNFFLALINKKSNEILAISRYMVEQNTPLPPKETYEAMFIQNPHFKGALRMDMIDKLLLTNAKTIWLILLIVALDYKMQSMKFLLRTISEWYNEQDFRDKVLMSYCIPPNRKVQNIEFSPEDIRLAKNLFGTLAVKTFAHRRVFLPPSLDITLNYSSSIKRKHNILNNK
jgi:hypothetical protein